METARYPQVYDQSAPSCTLLDCRDHATEHVVRADGLAEVFCLPHAAQAARPTAVRRRFTTGHMVGAGAVGVYGGVLAGAGTPLWLAAVLTLATSVMVAAGFAGWSSTPA